ncbi:cobalt-precorrin 5A hydrolase [Streptococcus cuniculi]|uniref:Cobalamin biosynthesis protein CbiG n=1 Tax=Streptococcus cuniculi TaxID=1432788 RepID=A0A4Y9JD05_9STRE|nr:cobalt-precorrin 5A hydrolase [Streptococcus cuniculi]MBF0777643.1 cobalt-precorrin 5A hydrolase [Streptococcus cuniculi]TFU98717.1 cobalamin biosynthesis protein CbiG [Streptococcus cuniculi]
MPSEKALPYAIVALTETGKETALLLQQKLAKPSQVYTMPKLADERTLALEGSPVRAIAQLFTQVEVLICIMATGIVVRSIAPVVVDKAADPAVIVMDEKATNVISLLSGHLGGANELTLQIAEMLGANPVITTATDVQNVAALDTLAKSVNGWRAELRPLIKPFNSYLGRKERVYFYQEKNWVSDLRGLTVIEPADVEEILESGEPFIFLTTQPQMIERENVAVIYPKPYILGVGARKNVDPQVFREGFALFCQQEKIDPSEIAKIVSIDVKKEEAAILALAKALDCPFETYTKEELEVVADQYPQSAFVKQTVGVGSVALASADVASGGQVLTERFAKDGCTYALAKAIVNR